MKNPVNSFLLSEQGLSETTARTFLADSAHGAHVIFIGTVRNLSEGELVSHLEFEAYEPMVFRVLEDIATDLRRQYGVFGVLLHHRIGRVEVGDAAVISGISSTHRAEAFAACAELMNRLKTSVPIWKKEYTTAGAIWVSQTP